MKKIVLAKKRRLSNIQEHDDEPVDNPHAATVSGNKPVNTADSTSSANNVSPNNVANANRPAVSEPLNMSVKRAYRRKSAKTKPPYPSTEYCNILPRPIYQNPNNPLEYNLVAPYAWNYVPNGPNPQFPTPNIPPNVHQHVQYPNQLSEENLAYLSYQNGLNAYMNKHQCFVNPNLLPNGMQRPVDNVPNDMRSVYMHHPYRAPQEHGYAQQINKDQFAGSYSINDPHSVERTTQAMPRSNTNVHVQNDIPISASGTNSAIDNRFNSASYRQANEEIKKLLMNGHNNQGHNPAVTQIDPRRVNNSSNHATNENVIFSCNFHAPNYQRNLRYNLQDNRIVSRSGANSNNSTHVCFSVPNNITPRFPSAVDPRITLSCYNDRQIIHTNCPLDSQAAASHNVSPSFRQAERNPGREVVGVFSREVTATSEQSPTALIPPTPRIEAAENARITLPGNNDRQIIHGHSPLDTQTTAPRNDSPSFRQAERNPGRETAVTFLRDKTVTSERSPTALVLSAPRIAVAGNNARITLPGCNDRQIIHGHSPLDTQTAAPHDDSLSFRQAERNPGRETAVTFLRDKTVTSERSPTALVLSAPRIAAAGNARITLPDCNDRQIIHGHSPLDTQTAAPHDDSPSFRQTERNPGRETTVTFLSDKTVTSERSPTALVLSAPRIAAAGNARKALPGCNDRLIIHTNSPLDSQTAASPSFHQAERNTGREMAGGHSKESTPTSERSPTALIPSTPRIPAAENATNNAFNNLNAVNRHPNNNLIQKTKMMTNNSSANYAFTNDRSDSHHISPRNDRSVAHANYSDNSSKLPLQDCTVSEVMHDCVIPAPRIPANAQNGASRYANTDEFISVYSSQNNQNVDLESQNDGNGKNPSLTLERIVRNEPVKIQSCDHNVNYPCSSLREYRHSKKSQNCNSKSSRVETVTNGLNASLPDANDNDLELGSAKMQEHFKIRLGDSTESSPGIPPTKQMEVPIKSNEKTIQAAGPRVLSTEKSVTQHQNDETKKVNCLRRRRVKFTKRRADLMNNAANNSQIKDVKLENNPIASVIRCNPQNGLKTPEPKSNSDDGHRPDMSNPTGAVAQANPLPDKDTQMPVCCVPNIPEHLTISQNLGEFYNLVEYFKVSGMCHNNSYTIKILSDINSPVVNVVSKENDPPDILQIQNHDSCRGEPNTVESSPARSNMELQLEGSQNALKTDANKIAKKDGVHSLPLGVINSNLITQRKSDKLSNLLTKINILPNVVTSKLPEIVQNIFDPPIVSVKEDESIAEVSQNSMVPHVLPTIIDLTQDETSSAPKNEVPNPPEPNVDNEIKIEESKSNDIKFNMKQDDDVTSETVMEAASEINREEPICPSIRTQTIQSRVEDSDNVNDIDVKKEMLIIDLTNDDCVVVKSNQTKPEENNNDGVPSVCSDNSCEVIKKNDEESDVAKVENVSDQVENVSVQIENVSVRVENESVHVENCTKLSNIIDITEDDDKNILLNSLRSMSDRVIEYAENSTQTDNVVPSVYSNYNCEVVKTNVEELVLAKVENASDQVENVSVQIENVSVQVENVSVRVENCTKISDIIDITEDDDKNNLLNALPSMSDRVIENAENSTKTDNDETIENPIKTTVCETNELRVEEAQAACIDIKDIVISTEDVPNESDESILQHADESDSLTDTKTGIVLENLPSSCNETKNDSEINTNEAESVRNPDLNTPKEDKSTQFNNVPGRQLSEKEIEKLLFKNQTDMPIKHENPDESDPTSVDDNLMNNNTCADTMEMNLQTELECATERISEMNPDSNIPGIEREVKLEPDVVSQQIVRSDDAITDLPDETPRVHETIKEIAVNESRSEPSKENQESCETPRSAMEYKSRNSLKTYSNKMNLKTCDPSKESNHNDPKSKKVRSRSDSSYKHKYNSKGSSSNNINMKVVEVDNKFILKSVKNINGTNPSNDSEIVQTTNEMESINETETINASKADEVPLIPTHVRQSKTENQLDVSNITYMNKDLAASTIDPNSVIIQNSFVTISYNSPVILPFPGLNGYYYRRTSNEWDKEVPTETTNGIVDDITCGRDDEPVSQNFVLKISNGVAEKSSQSETCLALPSNNEPNSLIELDDMTGIMKEMQQMQNNGANVVDSNCDDASKMDNIVASSRAENVESASNKSSKSPDDFKIFKMKNLKKKKYKNKDSSSKHVDKDRKHESSKKKHDKVLKKTSDSTVKKLNKISKKHKESKSECQNDDASVKIKKKRGRPKKTAQDRSNSPITNPNHVKENQEQSKSVKPLKKHKLKKTFLDRTLSELFRPDTIIVYNKPMLKNGETFNSLLPKNVDEHPKSLKRKKDSLSESAKPIAEKHKHGVESETPRRKSEDVTSSKHRKMEESLGSPKFTGHRLSEGKNCPQAVKKPKIQTSIVKNNEVESNLELVNQKLLNFHQKYSTENNQCLANEATLSECFETIYNNNNRSDGISQAESVKCGETRCGLKTAGDPKDLIVVQCGDRLYTVKKFSVNISRFDKEIADKALKIL